MRTKHFLTSAAAVALIAGFAASSAKADVFVTADITKDKDVFVTENITKDKTVDITARTVIVPNRAAEALALANQRLEDNTTDFSIGHNATMDASILTNVGVTNVNQTAGFLNQQGNLLAAAVDGAGGLEVDSFAEAQSSAQQWLGGDDNGTDIGIGGGNIINFSGENEAAITDSINENAGVTSVNQSAGDMNQQLNGLSIGIAFADEGNDAVALAEADLGQFLIGNQVEYGAAGEVATLTNSVVGNAGITGVNQTAGGFNQQANVVAVSATTAASATLLTQ